MLLNPHAPQQPHVSTPWCSISSWNSPGQAPSRLDFPLVLMVLNSSIHNFPNNITSSHLPVLACITRTILGKAAKEILLFRLQNFSPCVIGTHRGGGHQLLPSVFPEAWQKLCETCCFTACRQTSKQPSLEPQAQIVICFTSNNHNTAAHSSLSYAGSFL